MYAVEVRDHIMIAHSFKGELFGPAQKLHGATFVVDVAFFRDDLSSDGVVVDIGRAHDALKATLAPLNYNNLDDLPQFAGKQTTTEFLSKHIFDAMAKAAREGALGPGGEGLTRLRVTLHESHVARAWFEGALAAGAMTRVLFAIPGDLATMTGGYIYDRKVLALLPACGVDVHHVALPASYPYPGDTDIEATRKLLARDDPATVLMIDGLAFGAMPRSLVDDLGGNLIALCHHPLGLEAGLTAEQSAHFIASEKHALSRADRIVVTSAATAATLSRAFGCEAGRIVVAEPGVDRAPRAMGSGGAARLLAIGALIPRKGYDVLIEACARIADLAWTLVIVGSPDRAPATARALREQIDRYRLHARIDLCGEIDETKLAMLWSTSDAFVIASHYEGYGMVVAEAMAHGLPMVATMGGALATTVPDDVALKVPSGDVDALAAALQRLVKDATFRARMADASWRAGQNLPQWQDTAAIVAKTIADVATKAGETYR